MRILNICYSITESDFCCIKTRKYFLKNKHNSWSFNEYKSAFCEKKKKSCAVQSSECESLENFLSP